MGSTTHTGSKGGKYGHVEPLTEQQFIMFRDYLYQISGIFISDDKKYLLDSRVRVRMKAVKARTPIEYMSLMKMQSTDNLHSEIFSLIDLVASHETYFFRNSGQMDAFRLSVLPDMMARQRKAGESTLRIWSVSCSTGDEPYSLAIILREQLGDELEEWQIEITGTDISPSVIAHARQGVYGSRALRSTPLSLQHRYFTQQDSERFELADEIRKMVRFRVLNVVNRASMGSMHNQHVIFCRNTMIYFDTDSKRQVLDGAYNALEPGGYLFIGHSETLSGLDDRFEPVSLPEAFVYRKPVAD